MTRYRVRKLHGRWVVMRQRFGEVWWTHLRGFEDREHAMRWVDASIRLDEVRARSVLFGRTP